VRADVLIEEVLAKCDVLKRAGLWATEPLIRPRAWIQNFEQQDKHLAAFLLDKFTFYNKRFTDALLVSSFHSIGDGLPKGPRAPSRDELIKSLTTAVFTPVKGEYPNPTDSGYFLCRKARQLLGVTEDCILDTDDALSHAYRGGTVVFLDDFVGSGDQFISTWMRETGGRSFKDAKANSDFNAIYITLVSTDFGLENIYNNVPDVAVCVTHILENKSTFQGVVDGNPAMAAELFAFLIKYSPRLCPSEKYIANNSSYLAYGYKNRGLLFGFEHSIPDATLPIFWAPGTNGWEPLIERR